MSNTPTRHTLEVYHGYYEQGSQYVPVVSVHRRHLFYYHKVLPPEPTLYAARVAAASHHIPLPLVQPLPFSQQPRPLSGMKQ